MMRLALLLSALGLSAGLLAGCGQTPPGTLRAMGTVSPESAFAAANDVMGQYYSIESADPRTLTITSRPKDVQARGERLLGGSPAREIATLTIRREAGEAAAYLSIMIQRQGSAGYRQFRTMHEDYSSVPDQTPAEAEAATTGQQNEAWQTTGFDHPKEATILSDLYNALHPSVGGGPASAAATEPATAEPAAIDE